MVAIREKNRLEEQKKMKKILKSAYRETAVEDYEINKDWEFTVGDGIE